MLTDVVERGREGVEEREVCRVEMTSLLTAEPGKPKTIRDPQCNPRFPFVYGSHLKKIPAIFFYFLQLRGSRFGDLGLIPLPFHPSHSFLFSTFPPSTSSHPFSPIGLICGGSPLATSSLVLHRCFLLLSTVKVSALVR